MFFPSFIPGSYIQAAEKSFSMVRGGRAREAAALAWERQGPAPDRTSYKNWAKSVLDNPAVVDSKVKSSTTCQWFQPCTKFQNITKVRVLTPQKADVVYVCDCPGALYHRSSSGDPMCCHKKATPEEGPAAVLGWVWYLQVCSVSQ